MKVAIDAGHGYNTAGKRSAPFVQQITHTFDGHTITVRKGEQFREHVANVGVAFYLTAELERCGVEVFKSAWDNFDGTDDIAPADSTADVIARQQKISAAKCDYSISCHFNASGGSGKEFDTGRGIETLYHTNKAKVKDGKAFAEAIHAEVCKVFPEQKNRGTVGGDGWGMCNATGLNVKAACIVECAFMTNQQEAENYFCNPEAWKKYAVGIAKGFCNYAGIKYIAEDVKPAAAAAQTAKKTVYRVQVGSYSVYDNAKAQKAKLKAAGFEGIIVKAEI